MAERRMFAKKIIDDDSFLDMPVSARCLYFDLNMRADDDGFVTPKKIMRMTGASQNDLDVLIAKRFIISFETGVVVIRQWHVHNLIRADRYQPTLYTNEKSTLTRTSNGYIEEYSNQPTDERPEIVDENSQKVEGWLTTGQPTVNHRSTQYRLGKDSIYKEDKSSYVENKTENELEIAYEEAKPSKSINDEFDEVWKHYPCKQGKNNAFIAYKKARKEGVDKDYIIQKIDEYKSWIVINRKQEYVKNGSTWFHQQCWNDDYTTERKAGLTANYSECGLDAGEEAF